MTEELRELIEEEEAMMRQRHLAGHGHLAPTDHADVGDGVVRGATRPGGDTGGVPAGHARDTVDAGGLDGLGQGHRPCQGPEPACDGGGGTVGCSGGTEPHGRHVGSPILVSKLQGTTGDSTFPLEHRDNWGQRLPETHHRLFTA
jgi:hypothetical protein